MDERRLHDDLESLERAVPASPLPALPARRGSSLLWVPAGLALAAGIIIGLFGAQLLPREPANREIAVNPVSSAAVAAGCPVTRPPDPPFVPADGPQRPPDYYDAFWYGTDALWAMPPFDGTWPLDRGEDGWYTQKAFWWSEDFAETVPDISVTGRRLDGPAAPIRADHPTNAGADFGLAMLVGIELPTPGCWELTATYRGHSLSYVVYVADQGLQPQVADLTWSPVAFDPDSEVRYLSVVGDRAFATGRKQDGTPAAWYSDDGGESWTASTFRWPSDITSLVTNRISLGRVVQLGDELVSLGSSTLGTNDAAAPGAIWFSHDYGGSWELSIRDSPKVAGDLATNGTLLVAVGEPDGGKGSEIWTSSDGTRWQQASAYYLEDSTIAGVAATTDRFLAVGTRNNDDGTTSAMTWESSDGVSWQATVIATPGRFTDVVAGPPALVVAGDMPKGDGAYAPVVMLVAQGFNLHDIRTSFAGSTTAVASGASGIVVGAQVLPDKLQTKAWFLPNGSAGAAAETAAQIGGFDDLVAVGDRFIGVSHCPPSADCFAFSMLAIGRPVSTTASSESRPEVTCEGDLQDCTRETQAVLDAVSEVSRPAIRIVFRANATCIWFPFGGDNPCPSIAFPKGTLRTSNAVVTFEGTDQQAFLNLFWLSDGSISSDLALATPPPGATPVE
jgi:hypothetical protein